jgi:hypothetical protein
MHNLRTRTNGLHLQLRSENLQMIPHFQWTPNGFRRRKVAVVSFASGRFAKNAVPFQNQVRKQSPDIDVFVFSSEEELGAPPHIYNPYSFKVYAIEAVRSKGYEIVMWCDSILRLVRPLETILPEIETVGVYLAEDGWKSGMFANDKSLEYFGYTRDQAMEIPAIWACFMGFDFKNPVTHEFMKRWKKACTDGIFAGRTFNNEGTESADPRCKGHRHDQTCAELISHQMRIPRSLPVLHHEPNYPHRYFIGREW